MAIACFNRDKPEADHAQADAKTYATVEMILADMEQFGDSAVRDLSGQFDNYTADSFRLTQALIATLSAIDRLLNIRPTVDTAGLWWRDYGEAILCDTYNEILPLADQITLKNEQVMTDRDDGI